MRKMPYLHIIAVASVVLGSFVFYALRHNEKEMKHISINNNDFIAEVAVSPDDKARGLGGRESIPENYAMVFPFSQKGVYPFWMKDMKFNIDIIWVLGQRIVHIKKNVAHESLEVLDPGEEADMVIEINAGLSDSLGLQEGDRVIMK